MRLRDVEMMWGCRRLNEGNEGRSKQRDGACTQEMNKYFSSSHHTCEGRESLNRTLWRMFQSEWRIGGGER